MCDTHVGRTIHCKPNTRAGLLNPNRLITKRQRFLCKQQNLLYSNIRLNVWFLTDNHVSSLPQQLRKHPATDTAWPRCGRIQQLASYPASQPGRKGLQEASTKQMWGCPQSSGKRLSLGDNPLEDKKSSQD